MFNLDVVVEVGQVASLLATTVVVGFVEEDPLHVGVERIPAVDLCCHLSNIARLAAMLDVTNVFDTKRIEPRQGLYIITTNRCTWPARGINHCKGHLARDISHIIPILIVATLHGVAIGWHHDGLLRCQSTHLRRKQLAQHRYGGHKHQHSPPCLLHTPPHRHTRGRPCCVCHILHSHSL